MPWKEPGVGQRTLKSINTVLREATERGWTETYLVRQLALLMPLDPRRRTALTNYRRKLREDGIPPVRAQRLVDQYAKKLRQDRARVVARTERTKAETERRNRDWAGTGIKKKRWVARPGACPLCQALHGTVRQINKPYGDIPGPPLHPNCRCREEAVITVDK
jgi:SPP1 gp7 family putative phage head morphogenesis protein